VEGQEGQEEGERLECVSHTHTYTHTHTHTHLRQAGGKEEQRRRMRSAAERQLEAFQRRKAAAVAAIDASVISSLLSLFSSVSSKPYQACKRSELEHKTNLTECNRDCAAFQMQITASAAASALKSRLLGLTHRESGLLVPPSDYLRHASQCLDRSLALVFLTSRTSALRLSNSTCQQ